jgi:hypothetical protein
MTKQHLFTSLSLLMLAPAFAADSGSRDNWSFAGDKLGDLRGPLLPAGSWLLRGSLGTAHFNDGTSEQITLPELAIGLPHRFEFRLLDEFVALSGGPESPIPDTGSESSSVLIPEFRWSFSEPGAIRGNPSLGLAREIVPGDADILRATLYLNDSVGARSIWGGNFIYQKRTGGNKELELIAKLGWHYLQRPEHLSLGLEAKFEHAKTYGADAGSTQEFLLGPSAIWRFGNNFALRAFAEFGITSNSPKHEGAISFEWRR